MSTCEYCGKSFKRESTIAVHVCEQKRRHLAKSERHVIIAFDAYCQFMKTINRSKNEITFSNFATSQFYTAFVKFGSFVSNVNPLYPDNYIRYVIKSGKKIEEWASDTLYDQYVAHLVKTESVETALERSVNFMLTWSDTSGYEWNQYFNRVADNIGVFQIKDGKISPWILLNSPTGRSFLKRLDNAQLEIITPILDIGAWTTIFKHRPNELELVKTIIRESQL